MSDWYHMEGEEVLFALDTDSEQGPAGGGAADVCPFTIARLILGI